MWETERMTHHTSAQLEPWPVAWARYQALSQALHARADRLTRAILDDARRTCKAAGLDPGLLGIHPHNAMCGFESGKPWPDVNYKLVRRTLWLIERSYEPSRLVSRVLDREYRRVMAGRR